jgi:hypothetical protein
MNAEETRNKNTCDALRRFLKKSPEGIYRMKGDFYFCKDLIIPNKEVTVKESRCLWPNENLIIIIESDESSYTYKPRCW